MKKDFEFAGFISLPYQLRGRLAACPSMKEEISKTNNGIWDCPKCHMYIESIGKPFQCPKCKRKSCDKTT